jgi:molybdate transport system ATP-binding protein
VALPDGSVLVTAEECSGAVHATFPPTAVTVGTEPATGSARNQWRGRIVSATPNGLTVRLHVDAAGGLLADVTARSAAALGLAPGVEVWVTAKTTGVVFGDRSPG